MDNRPLYEIGGMKMVVNKENMTNMLNEMIDRESANINGTHSDDINNMDIYLKGYVRALKNLLFIISVNGE